MMRTLGYAVLGLLSREELSGYDLKRWMERPLGYFWNARHSQIYPELARLEEEGFVTHTLVEQSGKPDKKEYAGYLEQALRLLRPGGTVVFDNALWHDRVADPTERDEDTTAIRELGRAVREDERLVSAMLAAGDGLLVAVTRP